MGGPGARDQHPVLGLYQTRVQGRFAVYKVIMVIPVQREPSGDMNPNHYLETFCYQDKIVPPTSFLNVSINVLFYLEVLYMNKFLLL